MGGTLELPCGDEGLRTDLVQCVFELRHAVGRVDVDQDQPDARGRELNDQPFQAVRRPDPDPIATVEAKAQQARRAAVHAARELVNAVLGGKPLDDEIVERLSGLVRKQLMAMRTTFTSGHYRRYAAGVLAERLVRRLFDDG